MLCVMAVTLLGACNGGASGNKAQPTPSGPTTTLATTGPLDPALINQSQLRRVPGFSTALVAPLADAVAFDEPDPRGPCGASMPVLAFDEAAATGWRASNLRAGGQVVVRRPAGELQSFMAARIRDARENCPAFEMKNRQGQMQISKFDAAVHVTRNADQSLAVVMAVRVNGVLRAATTIEVRTGNLLSRAVVVTNKPMGTPTVRGLASLMAKALDSVA